MIRSLSLLLGLSLAAFFKFRFLPELRAQRGTKKMDGDSHGNYDLDGVSYDPASHNVVVVGDGQAPEPKAKTGATKKVVNLHAPEQPRQRSVGT